MGKFVKLKAGIPTDASYLTTLFKAAGFGFILSKTRLSVEKHEDESVSWQQRVKLPITVAAQAKLPRFQRSANEIENLSKVCHTFYLLEQKVQQACQTCRFWNWGVNQTQIPSLPSLLFSELVPIKHTHTDRQKEKRFIIRFIQK